MGSSPRRVAKTRPSASDARLSPSVRLTASFAREPFRDRAQVVTARTDRVEHARRALRDVRIAADETHPVALRDLPAGAGDRHFHEVRAVRSHALGECREPIGIARAGHDEDARAAALRDRVDAAARPRDDVLDLSGVEHAEHVHFAARDHDTRGRFGLRAEALDRRALRRVHVVGEHLEARADQPLRDRRSHQTRAD